MLAFFGGLIFLVAGYFVYGKLVEEILAPDDRITPAIASGDGVDYVILPKWKNMLIQLLNIAGVGPVIGVILGIKFGEIVFYIIPVGCVLAGATHDFLGGMMSLRDNGANLPKIIRDNLGKGYAAVFSWFMVFLLVLVVAVFINIPANLIDKTFLPDIPFFWWAVAAVFIYYIVATLFPVDKIIGAIYPFFGGLLLLGTLSLLAVLTVWVIRDPALLLESEAFKAGKYTSEHAPVIPLLFVTIACGIISGFHATQAPIVARTMRSEREARATFYGTMILEGIIGMIWAGAAMAIFNKMPELMADKGGVVTLNKITVSMLGEWMGTITVVAVIILAITSGDTALRSARLSLAEMLRVQQKSLHSRVLICLPLIAMTAAILWWSHSDTKSFAFLWNYFAWGNQILAATTSMAAAVWLLRQGKKPYIAFIPGIFMTFIVVTYILWTSPAHKQAYGFGLPIHIAMAAGAAVAVIFAAVVYRLGKKNNALNNN